MGIWPWARKECDGALWKTLWDTALLEVGEQPGQPHQVTIPDFPGIQGALCTFQGAAAVPTLLIFNPPVSLDGP